jgi:hypothetical protein
MPETVLGLPVHALIVHATVIVVPVAALLLVATVLVPRLRVWAGPLPLLLALASLVLVPMTVRSGENLEAAIGTSEAINDHAALGEMVIYWVVGLTAVAAVSYLLRRRGREPHRALTVTVAVVGVVVGIGTVVQVVLTGHAGAEAVWSGVVPS